VAIYLIAIAILALCVYILPAIFKEMIDVMPIQYELLPILISTSLSTIPFYIALHQALKILDYIEKNKAFSGLSVKALKNVKYCAVTIGVLYALCSPFLFIIADGTDAPGIFAIGLVIIFACAVIAVFTEVIQKLLQNAIDIKAENDLTV
jgi:hypothetical protein